jgi:hypothetical protein
MVHVHCADRKVLRSLIILVCWEVWKERNSQIVERNGATNQQVQNKIRDEGGFGKRMEQNICQFFFFLDPVVCIL